MALHAASAFGTLAVLIGRYRLRRSDRIRGVGYANPCAPILPRSTTTSTLRASRTVHLAGHHGTVLRTPAQPIEPPARQCYLPHQAMSWPVRRAGAISRPRPLVTLTAWRTGDCRFRYSKASGGRSPRWSRHLRPSHQRRRHRPRGELHLMSWSTLHLGDHWRSVDSRDRRGAGAKDRGQREHVACLRRGLRRRAGTTANSDPLAQATRCHGRAQ